MLLQPLTAGKVVLFCPTMRTTTAAAAVSLLHWPPDHTGSSFPPPCDLMMMKKRILFSHGADDDGDGAASVKIKEKRLNPGNNLYLKHETRLSGDRLHHL